MWFMAAAQAGQQALGGWVSGQLGRANARIENRMSAVNTEASNKVRVAKNAAAAAESGLARWVQSVNNNRMLDSGGDRLEETVVNYRRQDDRLLTQSFTDSIAEAEQAGNAAAAQAVSGVEGSVVDMVNGSVALRDSIMRQQAENLRGTVNYDTARRAGSIMSQMVGGLDQSLIMDSLDYNEDVATTKYVASGGRLLANALLSVSWGDLNKGINNSMQSRQPPAPGKASAPAGNGFKFNFLPRETSTSSGSGSIYSLG